MNGTPYSMSGSGARFESSKYHDIPVVQTCRPPYAFAEASAYAKATADKTAAQVASREIYHF